MRKSPVEAGKVFKAIVPLRHRVQILREIAGSIRVANEVERSKWGLRLNPSSLMLKVGFVEVLQVSSEGLHELVLESEVPAQLRLDRSLRFGDPPYKNAPDCGYCDTSFAGAQRLGERLRFAHENAIRVAARSPRHTTTVRDHSPGLVAFINRELGVHLPQPSYAEKAREEPLDVTEGLDENQMYPEGMGMMVMVNRYERSAVARQKCKERYGTKCFLCDLEMGNFYGPEVAGLIHVHHLDPISSAERETDPVRDLRPVCPNCHAVIHSRRPPRTIEEVKEMLRAAAR